MNYVSPEVRALAQMVFDRYKDQINILHAPADRIAQPLLNQLKREGLITEHSFVEWQGMCEFNQIVVFWHKEENVGPDDKPSSFVINSDFTFTKE